MRVYSLVGKPQNSSCYTSFDFALQRYNSLANIASTMLDAGYCHRYVDCLCVCVLVMTVSPAKVTKPIETARADSGLSLIHISEPTRPY